MLTLKPIRIFNVTDQHVIYFDVIIDTVTHTNPFGGAGTVNCDQNNVQPPQGEQLIGLDVIFTGPLATNTSMGAKNI
ncbi:MAG: hypothetical protein FD167_1424 [bacterium]|nr:MAG: hypothetical protein FD167_1424 [bacterium]